MDGSGNGETEYKQSGVALNCPHCRVYVALMVAAIETRGFDERIVWQRAANDEWWIGVCPRCRNGVLVHQRWYKQLPNGEREVLNTFYPAALPSPTAPQIPDEIRRDIDEAKRCFSVGAYRACAVMARRALQTDCIEQGAAKGNLVSQLHELATNGVITKSLKEWGDAVRWVGNDAAHPNGDDVTKEDAEAILTLAEQFMHAVYVAPAIAQGIHARHNP